MNKQGKTEIGRGGDVTGYKGSRYAMDKVPNVPVKLPTAPGSRNQIIPRHRIESTRTTGGIEDTQIPESALVPRQYSVTISVAGVVPTAGEIATALASAYTGGNLPESDDLVLLKVGSVLKFTARTRIANPGTSGIFCVSFTVSSTTFYAVLNQTGIY